MRPKTFYNLKKLVAYADSIVGDCDTVSFDLFDTVLIRRIHEPDVVKAPVARFIASRAAQLGVKKTVRDVLKLRDRIEAEHRARHGETGPDHEACYPEYMGEMLKELLGGKLSEDLLSEVTEYELKIEESMLVPRADIADWIRFLHSEGKKVLIISDVYLPSEYLKRFVDAAGLGSCVDAVISSADSLKAKASGAGYTLVKERYELDYSRWMHIGDNPISDGLRAAEAGIRALVIRDVGEKRRKSIIRRQCQYTGLPFWRGRAVQQLMLPLEAENGDRSPLYVEGYNFFAPVLGAFIQGIAERARERGIRRLYFFSREGWIFKECWERIMPYLYPDGNLPECSYFYASRMALAGASCAQQGLTPENARIAFLPPGNRDFRDLARVFGLDVEPLKPHLARYDLTETTSLSPLYPDCTTQNRVAYNDLLDDEEFQAEVAKQTAPTGKLLEKYLEQEDFFQHDDVAVVDIGWLSSIQRFLSEAVKHREDTPRIHGFVLGASRLIPYPTTAENHFDGLIYDGHHFDFGGSLIMYARDVFEEACRAPHPGLVGYESEGGKVVPRFRHEDDETAIAEKDQTEYFAPLQEGILDGAARYGAAAAMLGYKLEDVKPWINYLLLSKLAFPRASEVESLRQKHHLDDFYGKHKPPKAFRRAQKHLWDRSSMSLRFSPFLRTLYFLKHMKQMLNR